MEWYTVSDIQEYIEYIIINMKILPNNCPIHIYTNRIDNRLVFKIKHWYKIEPQSPETIKLVDRTKKSIDKTNNGENVPSFEVVEVVLV